MNWTTHVGTTREVEDFVAAVRNRLADLGEDEREELLGGLEADVSELVAERGSSALGDPLVYADELRAAAGLPQPRRRTASQGPRVAHLPDRARAWWEGLVAQPRVAPVWTVLRTLAPAWWVVRGWVAAVLVARAVPGWTNWGFLLVPGVSEALGVGLLVGAISLSILVGTGRAWPGASVSGGRGPAARAVLLVLNVLALVLLPVAYQWLNDAKWAAVHAASLGDTWVAEQGVLNRGRQVCNIAAYDAQGRPITGVQLFDQGGRPLDVRCYDQQATTVPWVLGDVARWNVFPLGERPRPVRNPERRSDLTGAAFPVPDRATTPAVTNPLLPPAAAEEAGPGPGTGKARERRSDRRAGERPEKDVRR